MRADRRREAISRGYRDAYASTGALGDELEGWEDEGKWPKD